MPKNCSADVQAVIQHVDQVFTSGNNEEAGYIKDLFGMSDVTHLDDVASACKNVLHYDPGGELYSITVRNNLWDWQNLQPTSGPKTLFYKFCDALEVKNGQIAPESGWGLQHALNAWGSYFKETYLSICEYDILSCKNTEFLTVTVCGNQTTE